MVRMDWANHSVLITRIFALILSLSPISPCLAWPLPRSSSFYSNCLRPQLRLICLIVLILSPYFILPLSLSYPSSISGICQSLPLHLALSSLFLFSGLLSLSSTLVVCCHCDCACVSNFLCSPSSADPSFQRTEQIASTLPDHKSATADWRASHTMM